jgi:polysaccharide biosynthesis protein PslG
VSVVTAARTIVVALVATLALAGGSASSAATGSGEFGVVAQGGLSNPEFAQMGAVGSSALRISITWSSIEPRRGEFDFDYLDSVVAGAAEHGIELLPTVYGSPEWLAGAADRPPIYSTNERGAWSDLLQTLARRYGPEGEFWDDGSSYEPITGWQIWNEPNIRPFWDPAPSARGYARLLRVSARALESVDPDAEIVLAGLSPAGRHYDAASFLRDLYRVGRVKPYFNRVALHPYAADVNGVAAQIKHFRRVMRRFGNEHAELDLTELGWASGGDPKIPLVKTETGQAVLLERAFALLARKRADWRIGRVYWFAWRDLDAEQDTCGFCRFSGLLRADGQQKPAWSAFRRGAGG